MLRQGFLVLCFLLVCRMAKKVRQPQTTASKADAVAQYNLLRRQRTQKALERKGRNARRNPVQELSRPLVVSGPGLELSISQGFVALGRVMSAAIAEELAEAFKQNTHRTDWRRLSATKGHGGYELLPRAAIERTMTPAFRTALDAWLAAQGLVVDAHAQGYSALGVIRCTPRARDQTLHADGEEEPYDATARTLWLALEADTPLRIPLSFGDDRVPFPAGTGAFWAHALGRHAGVASAKLRMFITCRKRVGE